MPTFWKSKPAILDKRAIKATKAYQWRELTKRVKLRDQGKCRICGKTGYDVHHIEFRSRGGKDEAGNCVLVCRNDHALIHGHAIRLSGTASKLHIERWSDLTERYERVA